MSERTINRLEDLIAKQDKVIEDLCKKITLLEYQDEWGWRQIRQLTEKENANLPVPRLELRYRDKSQYQHFIDYGLVYRHLLGDIEFIPISCTKIGGKVIIPLSTPFRDGAHMYNDMYELRLPGFVIDEKDGVQIVKQLSLEDERELPSALITRMGLDDYKPNSLARMAR